MEKVRLDQVGGEVELRAVVFGAPSQPLLSVGVTIKYISFLLNTKPKDNGHTDHRGGVGVVELGVVTKVSVA